MTDKIPVKNFNDFLENNDQTSEAFSKLVERTKRELKKEMVLRKYRYNKKELIEISKYPLSKITRTEFHDRLRKSNISDDLIFSLERKSNWPDNDSRNRNNRQRYGHDFDGGDRDDYRNNYRYETDNGSNWRNYRGRGQPESRFRKNDRYPYNRNRNGMRDDSNEPLPEWFSNGAESMNDFIDLKGFDDDDLCESDDGNRLKNLSTHAQLGDGSFLDDSSLNIFESTGIDGLNKNNVSNASSLHDSNTSLFNNADIFLESKDMEQFPIPLFNSSMNSSRADKWFNKSRQEDSVKEDSHSNGFVPKDNSSNKLQLLNLLNKNNIDLSKLPQPSKNIELSNAVNVSDLEASMLNSSKENSKKPVDVMSNEAEIMAKLLSLSRPDSKSSAHSSNGIKPTPEDLARMPPIPMPPNMPMMNPMFRYPAMPPPPPMPDFNPEQFYSQQRPMPPPPLLYPPEMVNARFPVNLPFYMPPNFPLPQMFMNHTNMIPHQPDHSVVNSASQVKAKNDDSIANKLLKNTQFTPTSVFRKLKDHDQSKTKVLKPSDMFEAVAGESARDSRDSVSSEVDAFLKQLKLVKLSSASTPVQHEPQSPASPSGRANGKTLNPNDIFNVFKRNDNNISRLDLPPLPLQNALTVDDIEKF